jgi:hypothetical protein
MICHSSESRPTRDLDFNKAGIFNCQVHVKAVCAHAISVITEIGMGSRGVFDSMDSAEIGSLTVLSVLPIYDVIKEFGM